MNYPTLLSMIAWAVGNVGTQLLTPGIGIFTVFLVISVASLLALIISVLVSLARAAGVTVTDYVEEEQ